MHPALGLNLERVVPASGLKLGDAFLPPGTIVGVNPWVRHRDPSIFEEDAEVWNPSRWIDTDAERVKQHILTFRAGKRTCLGKNIAILEIHKLVPVPVMRCEIRPAEPEKEWRVRNSWIVRQEDQREPLETRDMTPVSISPA